MIVMFLFQYAAALLFLPAFIIHITVPKIELFPLMVLYLPAIIMLTLSFVI